MMTALGTQSKHGNRVSQTIMDFAADKDALAIAFNNAFDRQIWNEILTPRYSFPAIAFERHRCAQAAALARALPASLDAAAAALGKKIKSLIFSQRFNDCGEQSGTCHRLSHVAPPRGSFAMTPPRQHTLDTLRILSRSAGGRFCCVVGDQMADYCPLLIRAISRLDVNTPAARQSVYANAPDHSPYTQWTAARSPGTPDAGCGHRQFAS
jgi:hypothetical protein